MFTQSITEEIICLGANINTFSSWSIHLNTILETWSKAPIPLLRQMHATAVRQMSPVKTPVSRPVAMETTRCLPWIFGVCRNFFQHVQKTWGFKEFVCYLYTCVQARDQANTPVQLMSLSPTHCVYFRELWQTISHVFHYK